METILTSAEPHGIVVIVHGSGEHSGRYKWLTKQWNENGFHVVIGDLPGQGETDGLRGYIDSFDEYIQTIVTWVKEAEKMNLPIMLLGHSLGGLAIIRTVMEQRLPLRAIILSSPCLGLVHNPPKVLEEASKMLNVIAPKIRLDPHISADLGTRNEEISATDMFDPLYNRKISIRWYRELRDAMDLAHDKPERFQNVPLLILQAGSDRIVNKFDVKAWFDRLPIQEKIYKEWEGLYHEVFNEPERKQVFAFALEFVRKKLINE